VVYAQGLLLASDGQDVYAVDPETGTKRWQAAGSSPALPLDRRKLDAHLDWDGPPGPARD